MAESKNPLGQMAASTGIGAGIQAGADLASGFLNQMFYKRNLKLQEQSQKRMMQYQNDMQRRMLMDEMPMKVASYKNAGLSTAALAGSFGGNVSVPGQGVSTPGTPGFKLSPLEGMAAFANFQNIAADARLKNSQAENQEIRNEYERDRQQTEVDSMKLNLQLFQETYDDQKQQYKENVRATAAKAGLDEQQTKVAEKTVEQLGYVISGIQIDNNAKQLQYLIDKETSGSSINRIKAEAQIAMYTRDVKKLESTLASFGISVNASDLTNFMGLVLQGKADQVIEAIGDTIGKMLGALPAAIGAAFSAMLEGMTGDNWFANSARATGRAVSKASGKINQQQGSKVMQLKFENPQFFPSLR